MNEKKKGWCGVAWDKIMCWNETKPGTVVTAPCPGYIEFFNTSEFAERTCTENGTWWTHPVHNTTWTNYNSCVIPSSKTGTQPTIEAHNLVLLYTVGYSVSLASLIVAVVIMLYWRRLHCKSNTLHINLFMAFILRASMSFMKDRLFVGGLGLPQDVRRGEEGKLIFLEEGPHWECRTLFVLLMFAISASQTWMLMEGLYLYLLVHKTMATERLGVKPYIVLGWVLPWTFLIPWIVIKAVFENELCWNMQYNAGYFWVMKGPWTAIVVINFFFFMDIIRVLVTRVRNNQRHVGRSQYRKFGKFILVLIPLFGIMYIVLNVAFPSEVYTKDYNVIYLYVEMGYNSFQGFILALLFCFLNEDVHTEMRRSWQQHRSRRYNSTVFNRSLAQSSCHRASRSPGPNSPVIQRNSDSGGSRKKYNIRDVERPRLQQSLSVQSTYLSSSAAYHDADGTCHRYKACAVGEVNSTAACRNGSNNNVSATSSIPVDFKQRLRAFFEYT
ncbi:parathyroid hormone/parathyroid hormone-related peptide receptor-like [Physella acuta]|uniref:parathyroid hormone/parathyroid hormone-related peptide receptor-like n=1 Tax=Physella acuta TaxID=109671 RepID=UPI0027DB4005|nr:parathyroid hormone/parathyroid hormone-related peptide receptor-like [Physella acuta]